MSEILDRLPELGALVAGDLTEGLRSPHGGRLGMSGEQVLRAALLKQMMDWSYDELSFHLLDSGTYRAFCRMGLADQAPKRSTLHANIKKLRPETFEQVNRALLGRAQRAGVEPGRKVRIDSTVVESSIHHPADSSLLWDVVRVLVRDLKRAVKLSPAVRFHNHARRARRRQLAIGNVPTMAMRVPLYRELVQLTRRTLGYAKEAASHLEHCAHSQAQSLVVQLRHYIALGAKIVEQTERRVLQGRAVAATDKVVSIFEPHTDVIVKDKRDTLYGHKVFVSVGASGMVLDLLIERGNPSDSTRAITMLDRHRNVYGTVPREASFDAGFTSTANVAQARSLGVANASFAKKGSIDVLNGMRAPERHRPLQRFRAGVEGIISFVKRSAGLGRCDWRGYRSFCAYAWLGVASANLLLLARHLIR